MEIDPEKDRTDWNKLVDNRDLDMFRVFSRCLENEIKEKRLSTFQMEVLWLKLRNLMLRIIAAAYYCSVSPNKIKQTENFEDVKINGIDKSNILHVFSELIKEFKDMCNVIEKSNVQLSYVSIKSILAYYLM